MFNNCRRRHTLTYHSFFFFFTNTNITPALFTYTRKCSEKFHNHLMVDVKETIRQGRVLIKAEVDVKT